ncbi:MAG: host-nuclease inhibitor Gam family protein [Bacteroidota bacterium]
MAKRISKKTFANVTLEEAEKASNEFATGYNKLEKIEAKMNEEINKVKTKYQDEITDLKEELEEPNDILHVFAREQKNAWGKKKSLELLHTTIGFRTGTPKVIKDKKFTWEAVLELMKKNTLMKPFVRTTEEINKESILAEKDEKLLKKLKEECYVEIDQDEKFFVTVKKEEIVPA